LCQGAKGAVERLVAACVRHRARPLGESVAMIVREVRPEEQAVEDDLLLLAAEVSQ
jgi:hypothetical protein